MRCGCGPHPGSVSGSGGRDASSSSRGGAGGEIPKSETRHLQVIPWLSLIDSNPHTSCHTLSTRVPGER